MQAPAMPSISKVTDLAILSSGSYGNGTLPPGWVRVPVPLPDRYQDTGFNAITYKNVATGEVVVAFTGTNDKKDIAGSDAQIATHRAIEQQDQAYRYTRKAAEVAGVDPDQLLLTGHSLGGALAQLAADRYGAAGITFNAPGVQWASDNPAAAASNASVLNIRLSFDVVSLTASPTSGAIGQTLVIPATSAEGLKFMGSLLLAGGIPIIGLAALMKMGADAHFMDTVFTKLGQQHNTDTIDGWQRNVRGEWTQPGIEFGQNIGANADQVARLEHTRALLVEINAMAVAAPERIGAAQAYGQALAQIQAQTGAQSIDMKALPNGDFAVLDGQGRALGTLSLDDQGGALLSIGDKLYSIAADGMNADRVVGPTVNDAPEPIQQPPRTFVEALLDVFQNPQAPPAGPGTQYADAGADTATDAGSGSNHDPEPNPYSYTNYLNSAGSNLTPTQQSGLALQLDGLGLGGEHALSFITLPGGGATLIQNADGDIVGEINQGTPGANGSGGYASLSAVRINPDGSAEPITTYIAPNGQALTPAQYEQAQYSQTASAVGLMNSIIGLQHWDGMSDLQRTAAIASIYNVVDTMTGGNALPGNLGTAASVLGLLNALDQGNAGGALYSGLSLVEHLTYDAATKMGLVSDTLGRSFLPGLGFVLALDSGDPVSIASSGLSLMSSLGYIGPWGAVAAVVITLLGSLFEDDIPMKEGQAQANWDSAGNIYVSTTQDVEGGGSTATGWMNSLVQGLQQQLANLVDSDGQPVYGLIPQRLPSIGYQYDPDGMNYVNVGHVYLKWFDANGVEQTRYYDGAGNRGDGSGETLAGDFMAHASQAFVPAWEAQTVLAHWQETLQTQGLEAANAQARQAAASGLPLEAADHLTQTLSVLTFELPSVLLLAGVPTLRHQGLIDIDGDGYLERTEWVNVNQALLAIDLNGDGTVSADELLNMDGAGTARNTLGWLNANHDGRLDASDPAFHAIRIWLDVNQDGQSQASELQSLSAAAIVAIDFSSHPPSLVRADGSSMPLTQQHLTGDVLGVAYAATVGGLLEAREAGETVLHALNTRAFDGQADHTHGGDLDTDGTAGQVALIGAGDARLSTTTTRTLANPLGFVAAGAVTAAQAQREVTAAMVRSAESSLFGSGNGAMPLAALALGAGAMQWPAVVSAASPDVSVPAPVDGNAGTPPGASLQSAWPATNGDTSAASTGTTPTNLASTADPARIDLSGLQIGHVVADVHPAGHGLGQSAAETYASNQALAQMGQGQAAINSGADPAPSGPAGGLSATLLGSGTSSDVQLAYPVVMGELIAGTEDIGLRIRASSLLANDSTLNGAGDPRWPMLRISAVSNPLNGQVALRINAQGETEVVFIPDANYYGSASFSYTVTDQYGLSTVATAMLELAPVNDAPDARDDAASGDEDTVLMFNAADLLANDSDVDTARDGDVLRITRVGLAQHGMAFLDANGSIRFVPDADYNGPAQFSYWVGDRSEEAMAAGEGLESPAVMHLTILPVNDLPVVTGETIQSDEDVVLLISPALLLANDTDVDIATNGQVLTISTVGGAQHGTVIMRPDGTIQFTPEQDYFGPASFVYTVGDGHGGLVQGTAVVNLASVNDVPVINDELLIGKRDATYTLSQAALLANDTDLETPNDLKIVAVQGMTHGSAVLNANGSVTFAPTPGYAGRGSFQYVVEDADGGQTVGTTEIDFSQINVNPVVVDDSFIGMEDTAFIIQQNQLLANDSDLDASGLATMTVDAVRNAVNGTVRIQADGSVRFDSAPNFYGTATFEYRANDGEGGQTWAKVYLNVQSVNDAPIIEDIWHGKPIYGYTYYADIDTGGSYLGVVMDEAQARALAARSQLTSEAGLVIAASYYRNGQMRPYSFDFNDSYVDTGPEGGAYVSDDVYRQRGRVIAYDPDGDSSAITLSIASGPQHGHAWANVYLPDAAGPGVSHETAPAQFVGQTGAWQYFSHYGDPYFGADPFMVRVTDGEGASTTAMVAASHQGSSAGGGGKCPIVMDLNGDGIQLIRPEDSNIFADVNGDGWRERIGWAGNDDGVLVFDANGDGRITDNAEISFVGYKEGARTDLDGLAAFDTNGGGELTAEDDAWSKFGVFRDANGNGRQDEGELMTLEQLGITAIGLQRQGTPYMDNGNVVFGTADIEFADGRTGVAGDVMFAGQNVPLPQPVLDVLEEAEVARLALLMSQYGALAQEQETEPLSHVNWAEASQTEVAAMDLASALVQTEHFGAPAASGVSA